MVLKLEILVLLLQRSMEEGLSCLLMIASGKMFFESFLPISKLINLTYS